MVHPSAWASVPPPSVGVPAPHCPRPSDSRKPPRVLRPPTVPGFSAVARADPTVWSSLPSSSRRPPSADDLGRARAFVPPPYSSPSSGASGASSSDRSLSALGPGAVAPEHKKTRKSNSERGKAFRARRKQQEDELLALVASLRREVVDLDFLRGLRQEVTLRRRHALEGSLVRLALQYFAEFAHGAADAALVPGGKRPGAARAHADRQEAFMRSAMDPAMQFGALTGWLPLLEQWRRYTAFHASFGISATSVEVMGPEESPVVTVRSDLRVVFSRDTLEHVFPHAAHDKALVGRLDGLCVTYKGVNRLQFSRDGRIVNYDADVGFVDALVAAGVAMDDLARLMNDARIADQCRIGDDRERVVVVGDDDREGGDQQEEGEEDERDEDKQGEDGRGLRTETKRSRFDVEFLLS